MKNVNLKEAVKTANRGETQENAVINNPVLDYNALTDNDYANMSEKNSQFSFNRTTKKAKKLCAAISFSPHSLVNITAAALVPPAIVVALMANSSGGIIEGLLSGDNELKNLVVGSFTSTLLATTSLAIFGEIKRAKEEDRKRDSQLKKIFDLFSATQKELSSVKNDVKFNTKTLENIADSHHNEKIDIDDIWHELKNVPACWNNIMPGSDFWMVNGAFRFDLFSEMDGHSRLILVPNIERLANMTLRCVQQSSLRSWHIINIQKKHIPFDRPSFALIRQVAGFNVMEEIAKANGLLFDTKNVIFHLHRCDENSSDAYFVGERDLGTGKGHPFVQRYRNNFMGEVPTVLMEQEILASTNAKAVERYHNEAIALSRSPKTRTVTFEEAKRICDGHMPHIRMPASLYIPCLRDDMDHSVAFDDHFVF